MPFARLARLPRMRPQLPLALVLVFLQRTPALRFLGGGLEALVGAVRSGQLLRAVTTLSSLGALHSLAGATAFVQTPSNPVAGTVGTRLGVVFTYNGTPSPPARWEVSGTLPPGLAFIPAAIGGTIRADTPILTGVPT